MLDELPLARPRVALVYGDADAAVHVRDAVSPQVQIVYSTAATEFDAARLADSRATAALLNLDSCDWLDAVETRLHTAGVAVVYNDPEISRTLEGWEQARWLRHLTAKLSGSADFDPPRPVPAEASAAGTVAAAEAAPAPMMEAMPTGETAKESAPAAADTGSSMATPAEVVEQPLSPEEIASMTVNFNAVPEPTLVPIDATPVAEAGVAAPSGADAIVAESAAAVQAAPSEIDSPLDVDTEALSALIDARLAEAEGHASGDAPQVWRVAHGGAVSAVDLPSATEPESANAAPDAPVATAPASVLPVEDSELMQGLPAIDDWQLVDRDEPSTMAASGAQPAHNEPELSIDFAGLELVPMEPVAQVTVHTEPIERWMHVESDDVHATDKHKQPAAPDANGGQA